MSTPDLDPFLAILEAMGVDTQAFDRVMLSKVVETVKEMSKKKKVPIDPKAPPKPSSPVEVKSSDGKTIDVEVLHSPTCECSVCEKERQTKT